MEADSERGGGERERETKSLKEGEDSPGHWGRQQGGGGGAEVGGEMDEFHLYSDKCFQMPPFA